MSSTTTFLYTSSAENNRITGVKYSDLVHIYGLARAGFVPEVLNSNATIPIIRDLFSITGGKALIFDPDFTSRLTHLGLPSLTTPDLDTLPTASSLPALPEVSANDIAAFFHTSGTTSGVPKPVPETHRWLKCQAQVQWPNLMQCYPDGQPLMVNNMGGSFGGWDAARPFTDHALGFFANVGSATSTRPIIVWNILTSRIQRSLTCLGLVTA